MTEPLSEDLPFWSSHSHELHIRARRLSSFQSNPPSRPISTDHDDATIPLRTHIMSMYDDIDESIR